MMNKKLFILVAVALFVFAGCQNELEKEVNFEVSTLAQGMTTLGDTLVLKKTEAVTFNFTGNPDFIAYYSGESGKEYKNRNRTLISPEEIDSELQFTLYPQYGTIQGSLKFYLSADFGYLKGNDKPADSVKIDNNQWSEVTFAYPTSGQTVNVTVPLNDYLGKKLTMAFLYCPVNNTSTQPTWEVRGFRIVNTLKADGSKAILPAKDMGFMPLDMNVQGNDAYKTGTTAGMWNLANIGAASSVIRIQSSSSGAVLNLDWLVSNPLTVNACNPDKGEAVKEISKEVNSLTRYYSKTGVYVVSFVARNANYKHQSEIVKELILKVID